MKISQTSTNFDFYKALEFHNVKSGSRTESFSMMHARICLLEGNFDKAELLRHNLDYNFDVITLNETWHI